MGAATQVEREQPGGELRELAHVLAPVLYLCVQVAVLVFTVFVVATIERQWVLHSIFRKGDVDAAVAFLVAGAVLFPAITVILARLPLSGRSWVKQHFWQSAGAYVALVMMALHLIPAYQEQRDGLGYGLLAGAFVLALYATALNAGTLWYLSRSRPSPTADHPAARSR